MTPTRPNVLIILCDQLAAGYLGAYGNRVAQTPHIDQMAADGLTLTRAYVPLPQCSPARASMFTGLYPHQHHLICVPRLGQDERFGTVRQRAVLPESVPSLGQAFRDGGYRMGYTGPWHMGDDEIPHHGWEEHWRTYRYWKNGRDFYIQHLEDHGLAELFEREHKEFSFAEGTRTGVVPSGPSAIPVEHARTTWSVDETIAFIDGRDSRPWAFTLSIKDPHPPVIAPGDFADRIDPAEVELPPTLDEDFVGKSDAYERSVTHRWVRNMTRSDWRRLIAHYHGLNAHIDTEVGRVLAHLDATGQRDNTLIVFLSDHGEMMGSHRMAGKGPAMFEESLGIPVIVRWPDAIPAGRRSDALFNTVDLVATLGALCGVAVHPGSGLDQSAMFLGQGEGPRRTVFAEFYVEAGLRDDLMFVKTAVTDRWKLNLWLYDRPELYDLYTDPHETRNLIDDSAHADVRDALVGEIVDWVRETEDPLLPTVEWTAGRVHSTWDVATQTWTGRPV